MVENLTAKKNNINSVDVFVFLLRKVLFLNTFHCKIGRNSIEIDRFS